MVIPSPFAIDFQCRQANVIPHSYRRRRSAPLSMSHPGATKGAMNTRLVLGITFSTVLACWLMVQPVEAGQEGSVTGFVTTSNGDPIAGVIVIGSGSGLWRWATTDKDGR